jgi:hypothetical protein
LATPSTGTSRPGVRVGSASEFSLFFRVRPGHENDLREAVRALQDSPGYVAEAALRVTGRDTVAHPWTVGWSLGCQGWMPNGPSWP